MNVQLTLIDPEVETGSTGCQVLLLQVSDPSEFAAWYAFSFKGWTDVDHSVEFYITIKVLIRKRLQERGMVPILFL